MSESKTTNYVCRNCGKLSVFCLDEYVSCPRCGNEILEEI